MNSQVSCPPDRTVNQFLIHGIVGSYNPSGLNEARTPVRDGQAGLQTLLDVKSSQGATYCSAGTGDNAPLGNDGVAAVIGHPRFSDDQLTDLARREGPAKALAQAYSMYGDKFLTYMRGPFSFCLVDSDNQRVIAGIDRLGQFPLFYLKLEDGVAWGTTANSLISHAGDKAPLLPQGIYDYVYFHMLPSPNAIFEQLKKLPAAHCLKYDKKKLTIFNYWQPTFRETTSRSFEGACAELKPLLRKAVTRAIGDEIAVGAFLSGGLDSSSVTGMLAEISDGQAQAFSIGFAEEGYDEMAFARKTADHFGVKLHEYYVTPQDVVEALPLIASSYDEPFGNSSALPTYFCARLAKEAGVKRLLGGDGGDEIFAGNERYARQKIFERYAAIPTPIRSGVIEPLLSIMPSGNSLVSKAISYVRQASTPLPDRLQNYNFLHQFNPKDIFSSGFLHLIDTETPLKLQRHTYELPGDATRQNRMLYLDWQYTLADNDLRKVSQMCAVAGVDVAYPMLDDDLIEFSCGIPSNWKLKGQHLRHYYKQALQDWLPAETISKSKQGFGLPFGVWMQSYSPLRELAYESLLELKKRDFFRPDFIDHTINIHRTGHAAYYGELVWVLTVFEMWLAAHKPRSQFDTNNNTHG
jgi:asparagine synthase (glutamine-hydrolysing)